jgi:hypothetical protein
METAMQISVRDGAASSGAAVSVGFLWGSLFGAVFFGAAAGQHLFHLGAMFFHAAPLERVAPSYCATIMPFLSMNTSPACTTEA